MKSKFTTLFLAMFSVCFATTAWTAPGITSVNGTLNSGSVIQISGTGFGFNGPTVHFFDDFEQGQVDTPIATGTGSALIGQIGGLGSNKPYYTNTRAISGSQSLQVDMSVRDGSSQAEIPLPDSTQVFISWWMQLKGSYWPGLDPGGIGGNWKTVWLMGEKGDPNIDQTFPTIFGETYTYITANSSPYRNEINAAMGVGLNKWMRCWTWIDGKPDNTGTLQYWRLKEGGVDQIVNATNIQTMWTGSRYDTVNLNGYARKTIDSYPTYDDVYIAIGPNARARVEIGNAATYNASTNLTLATVNNWTDTSISATFRQGSLPNGSQAYLYVFDANGTPNSTGYPITIGELSGGSAPPPLLPPASVRIVSAN